MGVEGSADVSCLSSPQLLRLTSWERTAMDICEGAVSERGMQIGRCPVVKVCCAGP